MTQIPRFIVLTGKGGVGKTLLSQAMTHHLSQQGKKVIYFHFGPLELKSTPSFPCQELVLMKSVEKYVAHKLHSKALAYGVVRTPFFKALINMIPGFSYLVFLGHILQQLKDDPDLIAILDSPSSGHSITMFESIYNFHDIFQSGAIFEDTVKMHQMLQSPGILKVFILSLPSIMSIHEATELEACLKKLGIESIDIVMNNTLSDVAGVEASNLPPFLEQKVKMEKEVFNEFSSKIKASIPHSTSLEYTQIIDELSPYMGKLLDPVHDNS